MKILLCAMSLRIGGAETHIVELALALRARGDEVFLASHGGVYVPRLQDAGVVCVNAPLDKKDPLSVLRSRLILSSLIRREKFDIVHAHARIPAFTAGGAARKYGVRFVTTAHYDFRVTPFLRRASDWGDHCFAVSGDIADYLRAKYGYNRKNITLVPNGIDTKSFSPERKRPGIRESFGVSPDAELILHVSRLDGMSSLCAEELIKAMPSVRESHPRAVLLIVGGGTEYERISAKADGINGIIGEKAVITAGAREDVADITAQADLFVGPSRAAMEAMASGVLTVISGSEGHIGLFSDETEAACRKTNFCGRGLPLPTSDVLSREILSALSLGEKEKSALCESGRNYIKENYSAEKMAEIYIKKYEEIAKIKTGKHHDVTICGYYGFGNTGDEAMAHEIVKMLRKKNPSCDICIMSHRPRLTSRGLCVSSVGRMNFFKIKKTLKNTDVFLFGGGNLLQDKTSTLSMIYYTKMIELAKKCGCKIKFFAGGIGPVTREKNKRRTARALSLADEISMRDEDSLRLARSLCKGKDVTLVPDPVLSVKPSENTLGVLGIAPENYFVVAPKNLTRDGEDTLLEIIGKIKSRTGKTPLFFAMHPKEDSKLCRYLAKKSGGCAVTVPLYAEEVAELLSGAELSICSRLHALVLSRAAGIKTAALSDDEKLTVFLKNAKVKKTACGKYTLISEYEI